MTQTSEKATGLKPLLLQGSLWAAFTLESIGLAFWISTDWNGPSLLGSLYVRTTGWILVPTLSSHLPAVGDWALLYFIALLATSLAITRSLKSTVLIGTLILLTFSFVLDSTQPQWLFSTVIMREYGTPLQWFNNLDLLVVSCLAFTFQMMNWRWFSTMNLGHLGASHKLFKRLTHK